MSDYSGEKERLGRAIYNCLRQAENKDDLRNKGILVEGENYIAEVHIYGKYEYLTGK